MRLIGPSGVAAALGCSLVLSAGLAAGPAAAAPAAAPAPALVPAAASVTAAPAAVRVAAAAAPTLRRGSKGAAVVAVQKRLTALGYWVGTADGVYGDSTVHAVTALQKVAGLSRDGVLGPRTRAALNAGRRPTATTKKGNAVEVDLERQVVLVVTKGKVRRVLDASTGSGKRYRTTSGGTAVAVTPKGRYRVSRQIDGWRRAPLGLLYRPKYFNGGIAVHGATSVPTYPASHGCVRVTLGAMDMLWKGKLVPIGTRVLVR